MRRHRVETLLALVLGGSFLLRWPFRHVPLIRDEGEYAHLGQAIRAGAVPYLDVYNQKTPLVFYSLAALQESIGEGLAALRLATTLYGVLVAIGVFALASRLAGRGAGLWAALAFCVMTFDQAGAVYPASPEFFSLLWLTIGAGAWLKGVESGRAVWLGAAGVAAGLAYQTKQTGLALLVFYVAESLWAWRRDRRPRDAAREVTLAAAGFGLVLFATLAYFHAHSALGAYVEATWTNNFAYVGGRQEDLPILRLLRHALWRNARWDLGLWLLGSLGLLSMARGQRRATGRGLWLLLVATAAAAVSAGHFRHYYVPLIVPLSLGVGFACARLRREIALAPGLRTRVVLLAVLCAPWVWPAQLAAVRLADPERVWQRPLGRMAPTLAAPALAAELAARSSEGEPGLVVGSEPQIYYYAKRPAATRMVFTYPMTGPYAFARPLRDHYLAALASGGPELVLLVRIPASISEWPEAAAAFLAEVEPVLEASYVELGSFSAATGARAPPGERGAVILYQRRASPSR